MLEIKGNKVCEVSEVSGNVLYSKGRILCQDAKHILTDNSYKISKHSANYRLFEVQDGRIAKLDLRLKNNREIKKQLLGGK